MIIITITGRPTGGRALLYEERGRQGGRKFVPTYAAYAQCTPTGERFEFAVVRDASTHVFGPGLPDPYGEGGECPPSADMPYTGVVREDNAIGFRIQLYDAGCERAETLQGRGSVVRRHVQLHVGAAASHGCIMVAGRRRWYYRVFERRIRAMLEHASTIQVVVEPRQQPAKK